jgi:hypothetical protein
VATIRSLALRDTLRKLSSEPLSLAETVVVAILLFTAGTIYCQLYCLVAFQQMHGMAMPLALSMQRSAVETIPALAAFELSKRVLGHPAAAWKFARTAIAFALVAALTVAALLLLQALGYGSPMPVRLMIADCLPGLALAVLAIVWADRRRRPGGRLDNDGAMAGMPPSDRIDWVQAAGNYVEVHFAGRTRIVRMTLRQALSSLGCDRFVQVHRSVLVNRNRISTVDGGNRRSQVRLSDGTFLRIGHTFRTKLFDE